MSYERRGEGWRTFGWVLLAGCVLAFVYWCLPKDLRAYQAPSGQSQAAVWEVHQIQPHQTRPR